MNEYQRLCAFLKIVYANLFTLHHNLVGGNWFGDHEHLQDYYEHIGDMLDELVERGLSLGFKEPCINEAVLAFSNDILPCMDRDKETSFSYVLKAFRSAAGMMTAAKEITPPDVQNKLEEFIYYLNFEADYKIARLLGHTSGEQAEIDDD